MKKTIELNTLIEYNYLNKLHYKFLYNVISKTYYSYKQEVFYLKSSIKETRVVYHSNSKNKLEKSITENRLFISKDIFYLGDGMYFWTNERDCDYWYEKKIKENKNNKIQTDIIKAKFSLCYDSNCIYDLTCDKEFELLEKLAQKLKINKCKLGVLINAIYNCNNKTIRNYINNYKVFRCFVEYKNIDNNTSKKYSEIIHKNQIFNVKCKEIFCVKSDDGIIKFIDVI
ncbi:hypothetical protein [Peptoanaerobacter stomatis]|nr:hypothetical protein [Peptoanaerobacter stomatis]